MNEEKKKDNVEMVIKSASVDSQEVTAAELRAINKLTLNPLTKDEVFTFKLAMCDNEIDRDFEVFPLKTLQDLAKMYVGKTVIKDHRHVADNQVARIYSTELVQDGAKTTKNGELYTQLVAHCYMLNIDSNKDLIAEIKGGIKIEVSVGCACGSANCSICGTDNRKDYCPHYWGKTYDGKMCYFKLEDAKDAYEVSFVAVPAQPKAGTTKQYGADFKEFEAEVLEDSPTLETVEDNSMDASRENATEEVGEVATPENNSNDLKSLEISNRMRLLDKFIQDKEKEM